MTWLVSYAIGFVLYFAPMYALYSQAKYDVEVWSWSRSGESVHSRQRETSSSSLEEALRKRTVMSRLLLLCPVWPVGVLIVVTQVLWWMVRLACRLVKNLWKDAWS